MDRGRAAGLAGRGRSPAREEQGEGDGSQPSEGHHPVEIGRCRTVEHWDTGYCYVFSEGRGKVSQAIDDRCDNLTGLRDRMLKAIRQGFCDSRASEPELAKPSSPHVRAPDPLIPKPSPIPPGAAGSPPRISIPAFRNDARRLVRRPMDVGQCRLVEHHRTGDCYVYSFPESQKVSETAERAVPSSRSCAGE